MFIDQDVSGAIVKLTDMQTASCSRSSDQPTLAAMSCSASPIQNLPVAAMA